MSRKKSAKAILSEIRTVMKDANCLMPVKYPDRPTARRPRYRWHFNQNWAWIVIQDLLDGTESDEIKLYKATKAHNDEAQNRLRRMRLRSPRPEVMAALGP
jgi:hypothetical protein